MKYGWIQQLRLSKRQGQQTKCLWIYYFFGVPISWRSKQQRSVALSEAAKEVKFIYHILVTMGIKVKTPITVKVDNVGAMFMAENKNKN